MSYVAGENRVIYSDCGKPWRDPSIKMGVCVDCGEKLLICRFCGEWWFMEWEKLKCEALCRTPIDDLVDALD